MQLFIRGLEKIHSVDIADVATVAELKDLLINFENVADNDYYLTLNGSVLDDDEQNLSFYGVENLNSIDLVVRLLGGKVHGSLARAGKVRGQTPKVDKKEKRKQKTGRAKRRLQYTRRFVNVVATGPGRRRGPNSNMTT